MDLWEAWLEPREKMDEDELLVLLVRVDIEGDAGGRAHGAVVGAWSRANGRGVDSASRSSMYSGSSKIWNSMSSFGRCGICKYASNTYM